MCWCGEITSLSGMLCLWDKGQNNLFIHVWVETGPIEMVLTAWNTTLSHHRKWEEDRPHETAWDVTLRTPFTDLNGLMSCLRDLFHVLSLNILLFRERCYKFPQSSYVSALAEGKEGSNNFATNQNVFDV